MGTHRVLPIKISFSVTPQVDRFVYVHAILGEKVYLIDAGVANAFEQIAAALQEAGRRVEEIEGVLLTHTHPDHIGSLAKIKQVSPHCKIYVSSDEREWLEDIALQCQQRPIPNFNELAGSSVKADEIVRPGDTLLLEENFEL